MTASRLRDFGLGLAFALMLIAPACATRGQAQQSTPSSDAWTFGFWYWNLLYDKPAAGKAPADVVFLHVGELQKHTFGVGRTGESSWEAYGQIPDHIPPAREYWLLYRFEQQGLPDPEVIPILANDIARLRAQITKRHLNVIGLQLDIDSPTASLGKYASFLKATRAALPQDFQLSITALLDWFRDGTRIGDVIQQVDEFVPQFYDVEPLDRNNSGAISAAFDAAYWNPILNRFGKRFRIGVASFGRTRFIPADRSWGGMTLGIFADIDERQFSNHPDFHSEAKQTEAGELRLIYTTIRRTRFGYRTFEPGDSFQITVPTPTAVRRAVTEARHIGGGNAGVVFFRWPGIQEYSAMLPDEVLRAASPTPSPAGPKYLVSTIEGHCAAVSCVTLLIEFRDALEARSVSLDIHTSVPFEYFLPAQSIPVRLKDPSVLEISVPPYGGRGRVVLGRAVTLTPSRFTLQQN